MDGFCEKTPEAALVLEEAYSNRFQDEKVEELRIELSPGRKEGQRKVAFS